MIAKGYKFNYSKHSEKNYSYLLRFNRINKRKVEKKRKNRNKAF